MSSARAFHHFAVPTAALLGGFLPCAAGASPARACGIDGLPSLTVGGTLVVLNKQPPVGPNLSVWAPFLSPFSLRPARAYRWEELRDRIPLAAEAFRTSWRWVFGDGSGPERGMAASHTYRRAGTYKITVSAYFPSRKYWYTFDAVQVRVLPR